MLSKNLDPTAIQADPYEALGLLRRLANGFMHCLPISHHFEGLFLGSAKAMSLADIVDHIVDHADNGGPRRSTQGQS